MEQLLSVSATHVTWIIQSLIPKYCHGCIVDHPSPHQHNLCLMMEWTDQVLTFFGEAYDSVDLSTFYKTVIRLWSHISWLEIFWSTLEGYLLPRVSSATNCTYMNEIRSNSAYRDALSCIHSTQNCISIFVHTFSDGKENLGQYLMWIMLTIDIFSKLVDQSHKATHLRRSLSTHF